MKKICALLAAMSLLLNVCIAFADTYEKPILFRGITWGATRDEAAKSLPDGIKMRNTETVEYWYPIEGRMFNALEGDYLKAELGCYEYARSNSLEDIKVAGYSIGNLYLYYTYLTGEDGLLIRDDAHTALVHAYYYIEPKDPDAVYADLLKKLTSLYGDVDFNRKTAPYISYEQNLWYGADGTMVSLVREDYPTGSPHIYIKYGYSGGDELVKKAYDAVVLEEALNAASNTDGL